MYKKIGRVGIVVVLIAVILFSIVWLTLVNLEVGMAKEIGIQEPVLPDYDRSAIPQNVLNDAETVAGELVGNSRGKLPEVVDELLSSYAAAAQTDVVIFFNPGGWGWDFIEEKPGGWYTILDGIMEQLKSRGYSSFVLNYQRTSPTLKGTIKEFFEATAGYPRKASDLARRVAFLTDHLPQLKVIIAGESTGTVISDKTMDILDYNPHIYSIQTGTPFWYHSVEMDRKLLMNTNGTGIDTFSYGNIPAMIWATFVGWFGFSSPEENPGDILSWLRAPGHDYSWQYPGVSSAVIDFIDANFPGKV
jgi:hypothetical protein